MKAPSPTDGRRRPGRNLLARRANRYLENPPTIRNAAAVIVTVNVIVVAIGGLAMRLLDAKEFPDIGTALWWSVQTATTVGYGDVTPRAFSGRLVGAIVMLEGVAFIAVLTAAITSSFVARAQHEVGRPTGPAQAQLEDLAHRLDRIEQLLAPPPDHPHRTMLSEQPTD